MLADFHRVAENIQPTGITNLFAKRNEVPLVVVHGMVTVDAEETNLLKGLTRDAAGGDIGYAATGEFEPDVGDIHHFGEDRHPYGIDGGYG